MTLRRLGLAAAGILVALAVGELGLRLLGCQSSGVFFYDYQSRPFLCTNPYWGTWHFANNAVEHRRSCFGARYRTNEFGMKGEPLRAGARRIALLGDSFIEGFGLDNDETAAHQLERKLGAEFQVLNFGVSGYFSTVDELALYDNFAKFFDPEITLLFFLNYNDLEDLLHPQKETLIDRDLRFVYPRAASFEEVAATVKGQKVTAGPISTGERSCLRRLVDLAWRSAGQRMQMMLNLRWDARHELARWYLPTDDVDTRRAWAVVEASLARLSEVAGSRHSALVVVNVADPYQLDDNWIRLASLREGTQLSATHPNERLAAICKKLGIRYYDMYPQVAAYLREQKLGYPFLSFRCDRHYDREGQELMAGLVFDYLQAAGLIAKRAERQVAITRGLP